MKKVKKKVKKSMKNNNEYAKAYVELYEIIKYLDEEEKRYIPKDFMEFLNDNMDKTYSFTYDENKSLKEQNLKVETKALLVKLYEKYLAKPEEKDFWKQYDKECFKISEEEKRKKYNSDIFGKLENERNVKTDKQEEKQEKLEMIKSEENWKSKIIKFFKKLFRK